MGRLRTRRCRAQSPEARGDARRERVRGDEAHDQEKPAHGASIARKREEDQPALRKMAQILAAVPDCCASNFSKLARRPGSRISAIAPPQEAVAEEPAGPVTAAITSAAKPANAMARNTVMAVPFRAVTKWLPGSGAAGSEGSMHG